MSTHKVRGISGIERQIKQQEEAADRNINEAFQDLRKLMEKAREMSSLAKSISQRMKDKANKEISDDETIVFKSHLLSLGVDSSIGLSEDPVTRKKSANENIYYKELARQIAQVIKPVVDSKSGQMSLTDVYCTINRARGFELISTEDLMNACLTMDGQMLGLSLFTYPSGLMVLQSDNFSDEKSNSEIRELISLLCPDISSPGISAQALAMQCGISVSLARQRLISAESEGIVCRDASLQGLFFHPNLFLQRDSSS